MTTSTFGSVGGTFAVLVFWHFIADWLFQTHKEAMAKARFPTVRAIHCLKYALAFLPVFWLLRSENATVAWSLVILLLSHYVIDSYVPVMLWAKHLRKAPQFTDAVFSPAAEAGGWSDRKIDRKTYRTDEEAFKAFAATPLGLVLMITMDQLFHIAFLLPVAWMIVAW